MKPIFYYNPPFFLGFQKIFPQIGFVESYYEYLQSLRRDFENFDFSPIYIHFKFDFWLKTAKMAKNGQNRKITLKYVLRVVPWTQILQELWWDT